MTYSVLSLLPGDFVGLVLALLLREARDSEESMCCFVFPLYKGEGGGNILLVF